MRGYNVATGNYKDIQLHLPASFVSAASTLININNLDPPLLSHSQLSIICAPEK